MTPSPSRAICVPCSGTGVLADMRKCIICDGRGTDPVVRVTAAQSRALGELSRGDFTRCREGWKTNGGRFVPLITVAKLRKAGMVLLTQDKRTAKLTGFGSAFVGGEV